jgi:hypothetical protein
MSRYEGKKHLASFFRLYVLFCPLFLILCGVAALTDETMHFMDLLYLALALLPIVALLCLLIMRISPIYVSEKGLRTRPQTFKSELVEWDRMASVQPARFLHIRYVKIKTVGGGEPLQLGIDMQDMKGFIRDVAECAPADNPLRAYLERGEVVNTGRTEQAFAAASAQAIPAETVEEKIKADLRLESQLRSGANWFYWIAGLSLVNTVSLLIGWNWSFVVGLGLTQFIDGVALGVSGYFDGAAAVIVQAAGVFLDLLVAGIFVLFGVFANKRHRWSFIAGMSLYAVDGVLCLLLQDYLTAGVHLIALLGIYAGYSAVRKLNGNHKTAR